MTVLGAVHSACCASPIGSGMAPDSPSYCTGSCAQPSDGASVNAIERNAPSIFFMFALFHESACFQPVRFGIEADGFM